MNVLKSICIALSTYSKIPVPQFTWREKDSQYALGFFPLVGVILGGVLFLWAYLGLRLALPALVILCVAAAMILFLTGGIHVDGFMDTMDAVGAYCERERRLEIMKDPHVGAAAILYLAVYGLLYLGAGYLVFSRKSPYTEVEMNLYLRYVGMYGISLTLARALSGLSAVTFPLARKKGMMGDLVSKQAKAVVIAMLAGWILLSITGLVLLAPQWWMGVLLPVSGGCMLGIYAVYSKKKFGGVTGDTAGWFLTVTELTFLLVLAATRVVWFR